MKSILTAASRNKVKDVLSVEVKYYNYMFLLFVHLKIFLQLRRLETELVEVNDSLKAQQNSDKEAAVKAPAQSVRKVLESQLKDYCETLTGSLS